MFGINSYSAPYTSFPCSFPVSGSLGVMYQNWPKWQTAMDVAQNCMASLFMNGLYKGMGVLIEQDVLLIPKHLISEESSGLICGSHLNVLIKSIEIHYTNDQYCYMPVHATQILEDGGKMDYCLLKLGAQLPGFAPEVSFNSNHQECLFAEIVDGQVRVSVVSPCQGSLGSMCTSVAGWTRPGSSGGIYLDMSGQLIGIHLGQSTGLCNRESGQERKILLAKELFRHSAYLCTLDQAFNPIPPSSCLMPVQPDICYVQQKKDVRVPPSKAGLKGYSCESREIHSTNSQRGIQIDVKRQIHNSKTRKLQVNNVATFFYQLYLADGKGERPNIHNNKGSSSYTKENAVAFYTTINELFNAHINQRDELEWPKAFSFQFEKCDFVARLYHP